MRAILRPYLEAYLLTQLSRRGLKNRIYVPAGIESPGEPAALGESLDFAHGYAKERWDS